MNMPSETLRPIVQALQAKGKSIRQIARTLGIHRATVRRWLNPQPAQTQNPPATPTQPASSKLDPFLPRIEELSQKEEVSIRAIFRLLRQEGYTGGRTILSDKVRHLRGSRRTRQAFARYEPAPGLEAQMDWSPYTVKIDGRPTKIQLFSMILSYSRYQYMEVFEDEKQDTLFQGHVEAFDAFEGVPAVILYDNQSPVVTGRLPSGLPLIHPRFETFARHYGFQPKICLPGNPERKGRVERPFGYFETNFLPLRAFSSLKDLRRQVRAWLDGEGSEPSGNFRLHGTTRRRPVDMWAQEERALLLALPPTPFLPTRVETRLVAKDCLISVLGNSFTVPPLYVGKEVTVLISPKAIKIYNRQGLVIAAHEIPAGKGRMIIDPAHYAQIKRAQRYFPASQIEAFFLTAFPDHRPFLEGLKRHLKSIDHIHLLQLRALLDHFTVPQVNEALAVATGHGIFTVTYVQEVLRRRHPAQTGMRRFDDDGQKPKGLQLGTVDPGDPDAYKDIFNPDDDLDAQPVF
jgi:transposase